MENNRKNILSLIGDEKDQETALAYLEGTLPPAEKIAFEKRLEKDAFLKDAMEGLSGIDRRKLPLIRDELNKRIAARVREKRKGRKAVGLGNWIYAAIILVLLLALISYWVISKLSS